jgi:hypothetical protein
MIGSDHQMAIVGKPGVTAKVRLQVGKSPHGAANAFDLVQIRVRKAAPESEPAAVRRERDHAVDGRRVVRIVECARATGDGVEHRDRRAATGAALMRGVKQAAECRVESEPQNRVGRAGTESTPGAGIQRQGLEFARLAAHGQQHQIVGTGEYRSDHELAGSVAEHTHAAVVFTQMKCLEAVRVALRIGQSLAVR